MSNQEPLPSTALPAPTAPKCSARSQMLHPTMMLQPTTSLSDLLSPLTLTSPLTKTQSLDINMSTQKESTDNSSQLLDLPPHQPITRSSPIDATFLQQALALLEEQNSSASILRDEEREYYSSNANSVSNSVLATPAFSPSLSSNGEYFSNTYTPYSHAPSRRNSNGSGSRLVSGYMSPLSPVVSRPSLGERRASSNSAKGVATPPLAIALPARPIYDAHGNELEPEPVQYKSSTTEAREFPFAQVTAVPRKVSPPSRKDVVAIAELGRERDGEQEDDTLVMPLICDEVDAKQRLKRVKSIRASIQLGNELNG